MEEIFRNEMELFRNAHVFGNMIEFSKRVLTIIQLFFTCMILRIVIILKVYDLDIDATTQDYVNLQYVKSLMVSYSTNLVNNVSFKGN
jgi:hypothetical protein